MTPTDPNALEWLAVRRGNIQKLLAEFYSFAVNRSSTIDPVETLVFQLLLGTAFSLWRAVFLADGDRTWAEIGDDSTKFLEVLVRDNAINYTQDRDMRGWSCGYYLNSAYFRLAYIHEKLSGVNAHHAKRIMEFLEMQCARREAEPNPQTSWDTAYQATYATFRAPQSVRDGDGNSEPKRDG